MRAKSKPGKPLPIGAIAVGFIVAALFALGVWRWSAGVRGQEAKPSSAPTYVVQERCAACHAEQTQVWRTSHHAQAMEVANDSTVLGNFNNAHFAKDGVASSFFKKDSKFYVRTDGPDGKLQDFELPYTFGVSPLQQYLVPFPNGRMQSLVLAWDSRSKEHDGQRWPRIQRAGCGERYRRRAASVGPADRAGLWEWEKDSANTKSRNPPSGRSPSLAEARSACRVCRTEPRRS